MCVYSLTQLEETARVVETLTWSHQKWSVAEQP